VSFFDHVTKKVNKAYSILDIIKRNFQHVDKVAFVLLYKALVRSHLEYANTVLSPYKQYLIEVVEKVQKERLNWYMSVNTYHIPTVLAIANTKISST